MKRLFILAATVLAAITANAQYAPGTLSILPKLGMSISTLSNAPDVQVDNHAGTIKNNPNSSAFVGVELEYQTVKWLGLTAALSYTVQGCAWENYEYKDDGVKYEGYNNKLDLGYINLPVVANFYLWKGLALKTGVQLGFLTNANSVNSLKSNVKMGDTKIYTNIDTRTNIRKECRKFDVAIPIGLSYEFKRHIVLDARYNIGLLTIDKEDNPDSDPICNGVFQLTFGYKFKLTK